MARNLEYCAYTSNSHHPPVTAYSIWNNKHGVRLQGYNAQKASFSRTINVKQIGHSFLRLDAYDEAYFFTLPSLHIEGLITGSPYVELNRSTMIQSSSGYTAKIDYSGKGWVSGKKNSFSASLWKEGHEKEPLYTAEGQWTDSFVMRDAKTKKQIDVYHAKAHKTTPLIVAPLEQQDPLESHRAWSKVARAIEKGDMNTVHYEKSLIENQQREMRKEEAANGRSWERRFFSRVDRAPEVEALAKRLGEVLDVDKTNGIWMFDEKKAREKAPQIMGRS